MAWALDDREKARLRRVWAIAAAVALSVIWAIWEVCIAGSRDNSVAMAIVMFASACMLLVPLCLLAWLIWLILRWIPQRRLRASLLQTGRFREWAEVSQRLKSGEGTLIVYWGWPTSPTCEYWTPDDLLGDAPMALPASYGDTPGDDQPAQLRTYAEDCCTRYLDAETGSAKMTIPPYDGLLRRLLTGDDRRLCDRFPNARIVTLVKEPDQMAIFKGDIDDVLKRPRRSGRNVQGASSLPSDE